MNREEAALALDELAASPASRWIGNKFVDGVWLQRCMRCGAEDTLVLPPDVHGPEDVPVGFDEKLFIWKRSFQIAHEGCMEVSPTTDTRSAEPHPVTPDVTMKRVLRCEKHGSRTWRGHIMCDACGRTYQTTDEKQPGYAPEVCRCGKRLMPPAAELGETYSVWVLAAGHRLEDAWATGQVHHQVPDPPDAGLRLLQRPGRSPRARRGRGAGAGRARARRGCPTRTARARRGPDSCSPPRVARRCSGERKTADSSRSTTRRGRSPSRSSAARRGARARAPERAAGIARDDSVSSSRACRRGDEPQTVVVSADG